MYFPNLNKLKRYPTVIARVSVTMVLNNTFLMGYDSVILNHEQRNNELSRYNKNNY